MNSIPASSRRASTPLHDGSQHWQQVERALVNTEAHVTFVRDLTTRYEIPPEIRETLEGQVDLIDKRRRERNLYLAVVGEFNSGKSTFINALLRDPILKAKAVVTTALETRIRFAPRLAVHLECRGREDETATIGEGTARVPWLPELDGLDARATVPLVTSEDGLAGRLSRVTIDHPARFLASEVTIVDTPGLNATAAGHEDITRHIIEDEADATVITIRGTQGCSLELLAGLSGPLKPYAHRCIFVVTKMDSVRDEERESVVQTITKRLAGALNRADLLVLPLAPQLVLDATDRSSGPVDVRWSEDFEGAERRIRDHLARERTLMICERLIRLLSRLFDTIRDVVEGSRADHERRQIEVAAGLLPDLEGFAQQLASRCRTVIAAAVIAARASLLGRLAETRARVRDRLHAFVFGASRLSDLERLEGKVREELDSARAWLASCLEAEVQPIGRAAREACSLFDETFTAVYRRLELLDQRQHPALGDTRVSSLDVRSVAIDALGTVKTFTSTENVLIGGGFATGAVLGTFLIPIPVIGTIIGGWLGGVMGAIFAPSLDQQKKDVWSKLEPALAGHLNAVDQAVLTAFDQAAAGAHELINDRIRRHTERYHHAVASIRGQTQRELERIQILQGVATDDLRAIEARRDLLGRTAQRLALDGERT